MILVSRSVSSAIIFWNSLGVLSIIPIIGWFFLGWAAPLAAIIFIAITLNNDKPNPATGRTANENYARELLQLFSIGVFKLNPNGTLKLDPGAGVAAFQKAYAVGK